MAEETPSVIRSKAESLGPVATHVAPPVGALLREALDEARDLVRLEVALAREEAMRELASAKRAAVAFGAAAAAIVVAFTMFLVALAMAFDDPRVGAAVIGAAVVGLAAALAFAGWRSLPKKPMVDTKERLELDLKQLKERIL